MQAASSGLGRKKSIEATWGAPDRSDAVNVHVVRVCAQRSEVLCTFAYVSPSPPMRNYEDREDWQFDWCVCTEGVCVQRVCVQEVAICSP